MIAWLVSSFLLQQSSATRLANHWKVFGPRASRKIFPIPIQGHRPKLQSPFTHAYWSSLNASQTEMFPLQQFSQIYWSFEEIDDLWNGIPSITFQSTPSQNRLGPLTQRSFKYYHLWCLHFIIPISPAFLHCKWSPYNVVTSLMIWYNYFHFICRHDLSVAPIWNIFADEALSTTFQSFINSAAAVDFLIRFSFVELCTHERSRPLNARRPTIRKFCEIFGILILLLFCIWEWY